MSRVLLRNAKVETREPQYSQCFDETPPSLGPMTGWTFRRNPRKLGMTLARYKFVAKMLYNLDVAEIGCADAFGSAVVRDSVSNLDLYDFDASWSESVNEMGDTLTVHDIVEDGPLPRLYTAVYMLDVLEHIPPHKERMAMMNICNSLELESGIFIAGVPSLESQRYAAEISKAGHVNCRSGDDLRTDMSQYFNNVFLFGMNDEVLHTGFPQMCHYLFVLCVGPRV